MNFRLHTQLLFCLLIAVELSYAQAPIRQLFRYEMEIKHAEDGFTIVSLKKDGLALIRDLDRYKQGKKKWQVEILDTTLVSKWSTEIELENFMVLVGFEHNQNQLYLLFREGEADYYGFKLITIFYKDQKIQTNKVKFDMTLRITHFTVAGGNAVFGGYVSNEPAVLLFNYNSEQPKILPGLFMSDVKLLDIRTNQNQSFNVLLEEGKGRENRKLVVRTYDHDGNLIIDDVISVDSRFTILSGITSTLEREEMIIFGTYGEGNNRQALGFYSVMVDPFNEQEISFTDFSSLQHFLDYLPERKADRIRARAREEKTVGNIADFKAHVVPFRILERTDGFYLLSEMYYPSHNINPYPSNSFYNPYSYGYYPYGFNPYSQRYYQTPYNNNYRNSVMDEDFKMIQSLVVKLGPQGKFEKDVSLKFNDLRQQGLEQASDFIVQNDSIVVLYKKENEIFYLRESGAPEEKPTVLQQSIFLNHPDAMAKDDNHVEGATRHWYDHEFYVWGYQTIASKNEKRQVFYVNRVSVE